MTETKITQLTELTSASNDDLLVIVDNPSGTPSTKKITVANLLNGWILDSSTWTYASASTFTVSGDITSRFPVGTKIKLTQTTTKYFYVVSATYSSPNTTVTVTGGSGYTLANATITNPYYSYADTPQGFPSKFNWSVVATGFTITGTGTNSITGNFFIVGKELFFRINWIGTSGTQNIESAGGWSSYFSTPVTVGYNNDGIAQYLSGTTLLSLGAGRCYSSNILAPIWSSQTLDIKVQGSYGI